MTRSPPCRCMTFPMQLVCLLEPQTVCFWLTWTVLQGPRLESTLLSDSSYSAATSVFAHGLSRYDLRMTTCERSTGVSIHKSEEFCGSLVLS
jgi:hypothetical protein